MSGTFAVTMEIADGSWCLLLRTAAGLSDGTPLVLVDTPGGVLVMTWSRPSRICVVRPGTTSWPTSSRSAVPMPHLEDQ